MNALPVKAFELKRSKYPKPLLGKEFRRFFSLFPIKFLIFVIALVTKQQLGKT